MSDVDVDAILYTDDAPREDVNLIRLYEVFCKEEGCRVNSALLRYMEDRGGTCSLERLLLNGNYLGPRGLRPVVRLIPYCQTLTAIDLENNGADNETVDALCNALVRHMSITWLSLRGNPITVPGGKRLLALLESNPRITHLDVSNTDIFDALQDRIRMAVLANANRSEQAGPRLQGGASSSITDAELAARTRAGGGTRLPHLCSPPLSAKARLEPVTQRRTAAAGSVPSPLRADRQTTTAALPGVASTATALATSAAASTTSAAAAVTQPQPRPPIPALASRNSSRLPPGQLKNMRAVFAARAKLTTEASRSEVSRVANTARTELQALETYSTRAAAEPEDRSVSGSGQLNTAPSPSATQGRTPREENNNNNSNHDNEHDTVSSFENYPDMPVSSTVPVPTHSRGRIEVMSTAPALGTNSFSVSQDTSRTPLQPQLLSNPEGGPQGTAAAPAAPTGSIMSPRVQAQVSTPPAPVRTRRGVEVKEPAAAAEGVEQGSPKSPGSSRTVAVVPGTVDEMLDPAFMMNKTSGEQFQLLFDRGCREYAHRNLDTAYMAWNEAMSIAVRKKNREWMAVVSSNLQRLSYELLVNEGVSHLENGELEEADGAFGMAEELAVKVRNATWEGEMQTARKRVLRAVFQRSHEAALVLFERMRQLQPPDLTADDYFVLPGTDLMVPHTAPFVEEWSRMLLVQEALGMWVEATRVAARVGGTQATVLQRVVDEALDAVAGYLARRFFDTVEPDALSWQGTSRYHYFECIMLTELWSAIISSTQQPTPHPRLAAVAAAQLGHLYLATNQLTAAGKQFERMVSLGVQAGDGFVEGVGLAFSGILQWQRANHSVAERHLVAAAQKLEQARDEHIEALARDGVTDVVPSQSSGPTLGTAAAEPTDSMQVRTADYAGSPDGGSTSLLHALPLGCALALINACNRYRVCVMTSTYRYREAIEMLERAAIYQYRDVLFSKMVHNFTPTPTLEQIVAVAHRVGSPLVYFALHKRYEWQDASSSFEAEDVLCTWLVPRNSDMRFVELNVAKDFKTSIAALLAQVRRGLHLDPLQSEGVADDIFTTPHNRSWMPALQKLYGIFMDAVMDFLATLDLPVQHECRVVTIIPYGVLWAVPFNILMDKRKENRYLIEDVALQMAFSATHCAMASLSAQRVRERDRHRDVVVVQPEADPAGAQFAHVLYPFDPLRSVKEGAAVAMVLKDGAATTVSSMTSVNTSSVALHNSCVVVSEQQEVLKLLPSARLLHMGVTTTFGEDSDAGSLSYALDGSASMRNAGAVCLVSHGDVVLLHSKDLAHMDLAAEVVVLSHTNMSTELLRGTNDDTMGLVRAMNSGGAPCVVASQWCTPDVSPMYLFTKFYTLLTYGRDAARAAANASAPTAVAVDDEDVTRLMRHKAISLACAMRALMAEDGMRYNPRAWAGYYCIGHGYM